MKLPPEIQDIFFKTLYGDKSVLEFEQWLYKETSLESILTPEDYLDFISYGYKGDNTKYGLYSLIEKQVEPGEYEKWRLLRMLTEALEKSEKLPQLLMTFYDLYCHGYNFLDNLGLGYGLAVEVPYSQGAHSWEELPIAEKKQLIESFYPNLDIEIQKVISWLNNGLVKPTGKTDEMNHYQYIDNRNEEEKKPTAYKVATSKHK